MRRVFAVLALAALAGMARADAVQFVIQQPDGQRYYAAIVPVLVLAPGNRWTRVGYTDRYGRINLALPPGRYEFVVQDREREFRIALQLTGATGLRSVRLQ